MVPFSSFSSNTRLISPCSIRCECWQAWRVLGLVDHLAIFVSEKDNVENAVDRLIIQGVT